MKIIRTQSGEDLRERSHELSASAKCILGLCVGYEIEGYMDVRPFQYLGSGACMIMRKYPNTEYIIPDDLYYTFHSYDQQGIDDVKYLWEEVKRVDTMPMRKGAFDYIQQNHSCKVRMRKVLDVIEDEFGIGGK